MKRKNIKASTIVKRYVQGNNRKVIVDVCDWGEPCCWACGKYKRSGDYDYKKSDKNVYACWNRVKFLQKAHIIPFSITGDDSPENFVLLCQECHKNNPNTTSLKAYQTWLNSVEHWTNNIIQEYKKSLCVYGLTPEGTEKIFLDDTPFFCQDFKSFLESNSVLVGMELNPMTVSACIATYLSEKA